MSNPELYLHNGANLLPCLTKTLREIREPDPAARTINEALRDGRLQRGMERQAGAVQVLHAQARTFLRPR